MINRIKSFSYHNPIQYYQSTCVRVDSVIEIIIRACMVLRFFTNARQKWLEYLEMFQISIEAMIHSFFKYFTKNWPLSYLTSMIWLNSRNRSFHAVEKTRTSSKCPKMKNARAKRAKILFFIVKYANLWGFCCCRRRGCLSSLFTNDENEWMTKSFPKSFIGLRDALTLRQSSSIDVDAFIYTNDLRMHHFTLFSVIAGNQ